jgi:hypothetical protein
LGLVVEIEERWNK